VKTCFCALTIAVLLGGAITGAADAQQQTDDSQPAAESAAQSEAKFDVLEYQIEGNTVLAAIEIERAVYPHLGSGKTIKDVEAARTALEKVYHDGGFLSVLVDIPEQKVDSGIVRLRVTEGSVGRVRVVGSRYYSLGYIKEKAPSLATGNVPNFGQVQKELAQLNRTADRRVNPVLKPSKTPGKVDIDLKVEDKFPLHADVELNNRYSANTTRTRLAASLRYDNLFQREHSVSLQAQVAPQKPSETQVLSGTYVAPLPNSNTMLAAYAVNSKSDVAAVGALNVVGRGTILGLRAISPLRARQKFYHSVTFGIDYKRFRDSVNLIGADTVNTPISYVPMLAQYSATQTGEGSTTQFGVTLNFALRGVLGNNDDEFENKRFNATANYAYLRGEFSRLQALPYGLNLFGKLDGQLATGPLISNEQFAVGGADGVRGYVESEALGDVGLRGELELRKPFDLQERLKVLDESYALAFIDGAHLRVRDPLPGQTQRFTLSGAGVGLRAKAYKHLTLAMDVAYPFRDGPTTKSGDTRAHFRLNYEF
jgi:hemolysin activation/secretion protein